MEKQYLDELYEILDEMNSQVEEIVNEHTDPERLQLIISLLSRKASEFTYDLQQDIEKLGMMELEMM